MRRVFWMGLGAAAGASTTVWAQRRVRGAIEDLGAEDVLVVVGKGAAVAGRGARAVARTVADAVGEGRTGATERELELRARLHGAESILDMRRKGSHGSARAVPSRRVGR